MAIELITKFSPKVDELFAQESKLSLLTNKDYDFTGANAVRVYSVGTAPINDYQRYAPDQVGEEMPSGCYFNRYGTPENLAATTAIYTLEKDRSFAFTIDRLDADETGMVLASATAMARQTREVIIPEVDAYTYDVMCTGAGTKPTAVTLTKENIYSEILKGSEALDNALVPDTQRCLVVTPAVYTLMKQCSDIIMDTDITAELRIKGVIGMIDGLIVVRVPAVRLPTGFGFMIAHPTATCAPTKLNDMRAHDNPPGISGWLCEGRINYGAFVLNNKAKGIYYQAQTQAGTT